MAVISSNGLLPPCTICINFIFFVFYSFPLFLTSSFSYFYSTYTTGTGDYYKMTWRVMSNVKELATMSK